MGCSAFPVVLKEQGGSQFSGEELPEGESQEMRHQGGF